MKDFLRFIFITFSIAFAASIVWFGFYLYGSSRAVSPFQTELVKALTARSPFTIKAPTPLMGAPLPEMVSFDIFFKNSQWVVKTPPNNTPLDEVLLKNPKVILFLKLRLDRTTNAASLKKIVNEHKDWKRIVFTSDYDGTLRDLRELDSRWTFSAGKVFLARFLSLSSLGLQKLLRIPGDVFLIDPKIFSSQKILQSLINEAHRQNKLVILGPVKATKKLSNVHGWVLVRD